MQQLDSWFLHYHTRAVHGKSKGGLGSGSSSKPKPLKKNTALTNLRAAGRKHPEVMVKIPKRLSQNSKGMKGIRNHLDYISRHGKTEVETNTGDKTNGKKDVIELMNHWQNKYSIAENTKHKEALNIVLSMPAGTPPEAVKNAAREFAAEQFANHEYVFALHTDSDNPDEPAHPHVHLCVLMRDTFGQRINPRKNDLFEWRVRFAEKLRDEGIQCAATRRQHRGKSIKGENSIVRAIDARLAPQQSRMSTANQQQLNQAVRTGQRPNNPYHAKSQETREQLLKRYKSLAKQLYAIGMKAEAKDIAKLIEQVQNAGYDTRIQQAYEQKREQLLQRKQQLAEIAKSQTHSPTHTPDKTAERDDGMER